ncbi:hypothetical protein C2S51_036390 [Perilla frutescens var. frutescens]|nr:hypothetical protein C2S51_036390 [Perilla frutescens var. frutescens]
MILQNAIFIFMEGNDVPRGWPFGLGNMNSRIVVVDASQPAVVEAAPPQPYASRILRSPSFSSFSSSNLDTESTGSFFPDQSMSLGRLIGIQPVNKGRLLHHLRPHHHRGFPDERSHPRVPEGQENSQGICAPLLHHVIGKIGRSASSK